MMLPKAKYPGRGYVVLQTDRFSIYDGRILRNNTDDKPISHRPVPKSYKKLCWRHRELLEQQRKRAQGECKDQQTLRNMINFEEGMKFDHNLEENIENGSKDGESLQSIKRRDIIRNAQEQLFNPDLLRNKYQGLIMNEKS
ncbi:hypothetical protein HOLleu_28084 [Holothuria leucospilota]|nr:hypothetical protein HOLleu_28084 [Holothuria leucospilota]